MAREHHAPLSLHLFSPHWAEPEWDLPNPFTIDLVVQPADVDEYGHSNNAVYQQWCDRAAWAHSEALGLGLRSHRELQRGMILQHVELLFLLPTFEGERLRVGNWIVLCDRRVRAHRRFQIARLRDGATVARALARYVCVDLSTGRAARMPEVFKERYGVKPWVAEALPLAPAIAPHRPSRGRATAGSAPLPK